jgi:hypothetical protein
MARPKGSGSTYKPEYATAIVEYFELLRDAPVRSIEVSELREEGTSKGPVSLLKSETRKICAELPTIEGFAVSINTPSSTVKRWAQDHPEFGGAYSRARDIQRQLLIDRGLTGQYERTAFIFVAKNITDMRDGSQLDQRFVDGEGKDRGMTLDTVQEYCRKAPPAGE